MGMLDWLPKTVEGVPMLGTLINAPQALYHAGAAGIDIMFNDQKSAKEHAGKAGWHALKSVPYLGTAMGVAEWWHDSDSDAPAQEDPMCASPYTAENGDEHCIDYEGNDVNYGPRDDRTLVEKFTDMVIPYEAESSRMADPDEGMPGFDDGRAARDANRWVEDKIDGLGRWLGILGPEEEDDEPVSVPFAG